MHDERDERRKRLVALFSYSALKWVLVGPALRVWMRGDIENIEVLDTVRGAVIASNHQSFIEHLLLPLHSRRPVQFWAKTDWWGQGIKGRMQGLFFTLTNQVPVDRSGGDAAAAAIDAAVRAVRRGDLFGIYPEGTRSPDGRVYRGRTGAARVAVKAGVPVVPCAVVGTGALQPKGRFMPRRGRFRMVFGEPIQTRHLGPDPTPEQLRALTDEVMESIVRLGGLEYVDEYARRR